MKLEAPRLLQLEEVDAGNYRSREGAYIKLRFERDRFAYVHMATKELYDFWLTQVGAYYWIQRSWRMGPTSDTVYPDYRVIRRA